jgi:hypothetical protein
MKTSGNTHHLALASYVDNDSLNMLVLRFPFGTSQQSNVLTIIHDAFQPLSFWSNFMPSNRFDGVAMDTHIYLMFTNQVRVCQLYCNARRTH